MIVVSGEIELAPESVERAKAAALPLMEATRKEAGCKTYVFTQSLEEPTVFRVFEEWDSDAALAAHFETAHMKAFRETLAGLELRRRDIRKYAVKDVVEI